MAGVERVIAARLVPRSRRGARRRTPQQQLASTSSLYIDSYIPLFFSFLFNRKPVAAAKSFYISSSAHASQASL